MLELVTTISTDVIVSKISSPDKIDYPFIQLDKEVRRAVGLLQLYNPKVRYIIEHNDLKEEVYEDFYKLTHSVSIYKLS